jgi:hypothetical protein
VFPELSAWGYAGGLGDHGLHGWNGFKGQATARAGRDGFYIPTHRKSAMDGAPVCLWLVGEDR